MFSKLKMLVGTLIEPNMNINNKLDLTKIKDIDFSSEKIKPILFAGLWVFYGAIFVRLYINIQEFFFYQYFTIDAAGFIQLLSTMADTGEMKSSIFSSFYSLYPTLQMNLEQFTSFNFISQYSNENFFRWHSYAIGYILAGLVFLGLPAGPLSIFVNLLGNFGIVFLTIQFCFKNKVPFSLTLAITLAFAFFLPIKESIYGQLYFDKLFPFFMLLLCIVTQSMLSNAHHRPIQMLSFLVLTIMCASISERTALMCGMFLIVFGLFYDLGRIRFRQRLPFIFAGFSCVAWFLIYHLTFYDSMYAGGTSLATISHNADRLISDPLFQDRAIVLVTVLLPHLIIGLMSPVAAIIAIFSVVPNLLIDIGGAEKTGFATHYHMMYLPFIIFSNLMALRKFCEFLSKLNEASFLSKFKSPANFMFVGLILSIFVMNLSSVIDYGDTSLKYRFTINSFDSPYLVNFTSGIKKTFQEPINDELSKSDDLNVTASNTLMTLLLETDVNVVDAFPISIYQADYALVERTLVDDHEEKIMLPNLPSYRTDGLIQKRRWLQNKLEADFETIFVKQISDSNDVVLFKRRNKIGSKAD